MCKKITKVRSTQDMSNICPHCQSELSASVVGDLCLTCGYANRAHHYRQDDGPGPSSQHQHMQDTPQVHEPVSPLADDYQSSLSQPIHHSASPKPQIVNHRASSHYKRRLETLQQLLEQPELESSIEPESSLSMSESEIPTQAPQPSTHTPLTDHTEHPVLDTVVELEHTIEAEAHHHQAEPEKPAIHRPSPYVLVPEEAHDQLQAEPNVNRTSIKLPEPDATLTHHKPVTVASEEALKRADALLASAQTDHSANKSKFNYVIMGVTAAILIGLTGFLLLNVFAAPKADAPQQSNSPQPNTSSSSPTPSNQTEGALRDTQRKDDLNALAIALAAYKKAIGSYPKGSDIAVLTPLTTGDPVYIKEIKNDPLSDPQQGLVIKYGYSSEDGTKFILTASLENKQDSDATNGLYIVKSQ